MENEERAGTDHTRARLSWAAGEEREYVVDKPGVLGKETVLCLVVFMQGHVTFEVVCVFLLGGAGTTW